VSQIPTSIIPDSPPEEGAPSAAIELIGHMGAGGRSVHFLSLDAPELPNVRLSSMHFTCLLAADFQDPASTKLLRALMKQGAVHITGWGSGSGRVANSVQAEDCPVPWPVQAVWFEHAPVSKAVRSFLDNTYPDETVDQACTSSLAVVVGNEAWASEVRRILLEARDGPRAKTAPARVLEELAPVACAERPATTPPPVAPLPSEPAATVPPPPRPDSGPVNRTPADPVELDLCRKLLAHEHLSDAERAGLPNERARFSVLRQVVSEALKTGWFPPKREMLPHGAVIESREGQIWVHEHFEGSTDVLTRRVTSVSDAVRAYIRHHGDPNASSIDGIAIDWGS
jgi:hypothetical protein